MSYPESDQPSLDDLLVSKHAVDSGPLYAVIVFGECSTVFCIPFLRPEPTLQMMPEMNEMLSLFNTTTGYLYPYDQFTQTWDRGEAMLRTENSDTEGLFVDGSTMNQKCVVFLLPYFVMPPAASR